jgi:hypothetical protein
MLCYNEPNSQIVFISELTIGANHQKRSPNKWRTSLTKSKALMPYKGHKKLTPAADYYTVDVAFDEYFSMCWMCWTNVT